MFAKTFISICLSLLARAAFAQETQLDALRTTLTPLREHANDRMSNDHGNTRGATPVLTVVKHQLRDWIEMRLAKFPEDGDTAMLAAEFHAGAARRAVVLR